MTFRDPIVAGEELIRSAIRSSDYVAGVSGWRIAQDGTVEFSEATVRGDIINTGSIFRAELSDGGLTIERLDGTAQAIFQAGAIQWFGDTANGVLITTDGDTYIAFKYGGTPTKGVAFDAATGYFVAANFNPNYAVEGWTDVTFQNGWTNFGGDYNNVQYRKDPLGFVHLRGIAKAGTLTDATVMFELPSGYRPPKKAQFHPYGTASAVIEVGHDADAGKVRVANVSTLPAGSALALDGFQFSVLT